MPLVGGKRTRRMPQRTCIGCRQAEGKRGLIRVVRSPDQRVVVDPTGRAAGRGAYLHSRRECWEKALKGATIERALKIIPGPDDVEALRAFALTLPAEESEAQ